MAGAVLMIAITDRKLSGQFAAWFQAQGACAAVGGDIVTDAFGVVAMVAMTPLIAIQVLGMAYTLRQRAGGTQPAPALAFDELDDDAIIEL